jgi:hypothetical protein
LTAKVAKETVNDTAVNSSDDSIKDKSKISKYITLFITNFLNEIEANPDQYKNLISFYNKVVNTDSIVKFEKLMSDLNTGSIQDILTDFESLLGVKDMMQHFIVHSYNYDQQKMEYYAVDVFLIKPEVSTYSAVVSQNSDSSITNTDKPSTSNETSKKIISILIVVIILVIILYILR